MSNETFLIPIKQNDDLSDIALDELRADLFYDFIESLGNSPENNLSKQDKKSTSSKLTPKETLLKRDRKNNRTILKDENGKLDKDYKEILIKTNKYETLLGKKLD